MIANLPIKPQKQECELESKIFDIPQIVKNPEPRVYFALNLQKSPEVKMVKMDMNITGVHIDGVNISCHAAYRAVPETVNEEEEYYLIYTNRTKPGPFPWNEKFCAVVQCRKNVEEPCKEFLQNTPLQTRFHYIFITGIFEEDVQYFPTLIGDMHHVVSMKENDAKIVDVLHPDNSDLSGRTVTQGSRDGNSTYAIGVIGMYGRNYKEDLPYENIKIHVNDK